MKTRQWESFVLFVWQKAKNKEWNEKKMKNEKHWECQMCKQNDFSFP